MEIARFLLLLLFIFSSSFSFAAEKLHLKNIRGSIIQLDFFPGEKGGALLVIAPGRAYHKNRPIISQLALKAQNKGISVLTFNWSYFPEGEPAGDLSTEIDDLEAVLAYAKEGGYWDSQKIVLAGKSLGSIVGYHLFGKHRDIKGLLLLTPICTSQWGKKGNLLDHPIPIIRDMYPGLASVVRPVVFALGNGDPSCRLDMLYNYLKDTDSNITSMILSGDHNLHVSENKDVDSLRKNISNINAMTEVLSHWLNLVLDK